MQAVAQDVQMVHAEGVGDGGKHGGRDARAKRGKTLPQKLFFQARSASIVSQIRSANYPIGYVHWGKRPAVTVSPFACLCIDTGELSGCP